jgi:hypothetical protein
MNPDATASGEPAAPPAAPEPTTPPVEGTTVEERAANALAALQGEQETPAAPDGAAPPAPPDDAAAARAARLTALRERVAREHQERARRAAERRPPAAAPPSPPAPAASAVETAQIEVARLRSAAGLLELAEQHGVAPADFGAALREAIEHPERAIGAKATALVKPVVDAAQKRIDALEAKIAEMDQAGLRAQHAAQEAQVAQTMIAFVSDHAAQAPRTHAYLQKRGVEAFLNLANGVAASLPASVGEQAVLDTIEDYLHGMVQDIGPAVPSSPTRAPLPAGRKAPPVTTSPSNRAATERDAAIDEDAEWSRLSVEERGARLKQRYA